MKILIGFFTTESNANIRQKATLADYDLAWGEDCLRKNKVSDVFSQAGIEMIPTLYANAAGAGVIERKAFEYIENNAHDIIDTIENTGEMSKECEEKIRSSVEDCKKRFVK